MGVRGRGAAVRLRLQMAVSCAASTQDPELRPRSRLFAPGALV